MGSGEEAEKSLELCIYCGMRIINLDFHFGVHDKCGEMELRRRWRWYKQWEIDGRGKILKRVNYLRRQNTLRTRKMVKYKMTLLVEETEDLGGVKKKKRLVRSSLEEVNEARKVAGLAPVEEGRGFRREAELKPLPNGGESPREVLKEGHLKQDFSNKLEVVEKIDDGGFHVSSSAASNNLCIAASPSNKGPNLSMMDCDEANNNIVVDGKGEAEEVNYLDLGQLDTAAAVALELINYLIEKTVVGGGLCDGEC